jgi:hypothetical protein
VYIGIIVRNDGALRAGKKLYIYLCGLCVARDNLDVLQRHLRDIVKQSVCLAALDPSLLADKVTAAIVE